VCEDLPIDAWLIRARRIAEGAGFSTAFVNESAVADNEAAVDDLSSDLLPTEIPRRYTGRRPSIAIDPEELIWAGLVLERIWQIISGAVPRIANAKELRTSVLNLAERLGLAAETTRPINRPGSNSIVGRTALDLRALRLLRLAIGSSAEAFWAVDGASANVPMSDFIEEVVRALRSITLPIAGADPGGLRVLEATDVRGLEFRAMFIAGLVEGGFPLRASRDWIYPQDQREVLKSFGLTLEDLSPDTLLKEEHYFYQAACRATERLYLTHPVTAEDGNASVASYYIEEARRAASAEISVETINRDFNGERLSEVTSASDAAVSLVRAAVRSRTGASDVDSVLPFAVRDGYLSKSAIERIAIESEREGLEFGAFDGRVDDPRLLLRLAKRFGPDSVFSASAFNLYGNCPFKFFARRILNLEPRGEAAIDLRAIDAGSLLHDILKRFFERHRRQRLDLLDRDSLVRELNTVADEVFDEREQYLPPLSPAVWRIDREIRKVLLEQVLEYERSLEDTTSVKDIRASYYELAYGMKDPQADPRSKSACLEIPRHQARDSGGGNQEHASSVLSQGASSQTNVNAEATAGKAESARIRGRIDRVDIAADGTAIAYDYKLSRGPSVKDMREGRDVQIALYLEALERVLLPGNQLAGGGYYALRGGKSRRNNGMYRRRMAAYTNIRSTNASSLEDEDWSRLRSEIIAHIWSYIDGMRTGRLEPVPSLEKKTCSICDYAAVCRYDVFRIRKKQTSRPKSVG
ncbi:MAG TPA: PD-(D/E)XK nuclease family protein, partial [Blastocatellia bacterium]|nr:PD-(D/E)XK nuclease family protein [Blastocatellia bacterium]